MKADRMVELMRAQYKKVVDLVSPELREFAQTIADQEVRRVEMLRDLVEDDGIDETIVAEAMELIEVVARAGLAGSMSARENC